MDSEYAIIGGGVVGLAIAWGLLKRGHKVVVLDGSDRGFRASRGNFGLVWVQSKGLNRPEYAQWSQRSVALWRGFADELEANTGQDLALSQNGGYWFFTSEDELAATVEKYEALKVKLGGNYPYDVLDHKQLHKEEPEVGSKIVGATLHHQDGHTNPLKLLRALAAEVRRLGGRVLHSKKVKKVHLNGSFRIKCEDGDVFEASKIVLSAGLGAAQLGSRMGFKAPIRPQRGQVLITEKLPKIMHRPSLVARQVDEGGVQVGATNEEVGFDDNVTTAGIAGLAKAAIEAYPILGRAQLVRSWGALRILTPDGFPIYQQSEEMPGAYLVTCHSAVTLAAAHALLLPDWLDGNENAPDLKIFSEKRFENA